MAFLVFGQRGDDLIFIDDVKRGKSNIKCPYCGGLLVAKKGKIMAHHFAHDKESCLQSSNNNIYKQLPLYECFKLGLTSSTQINELNRIIDISQACEDRIFYAPNTGYRSKWLYSSHSQYIINKYKPIIQTPKKYLDLYLDLGFIEPTTKECILKSSPKEGYIKITTKGKAFALELTLKQFYQWTKEVFKQMEVESNKIVKAMKERFSKYHLYFIEISTDKETFYKIGITSRSYHDRVKEIKIFVSKHYNNVEIKQLYYLDSVGIVEGYFKAKYNYLQHQIGKATEYFLLHDDDLKEIKKELNELEQTTGVHIAKIKKGIKNVHKIGKRGKGKIAFLDKPKSKEIAKLIGEKMTLRQIQRQTNYSINTIRKVKDALSNN